MAFYPDSDDPPARLLTGEFLLEPLHPRHVALDYAALMVSNDMLQMWSQSNWPAADFTLEENLADLQMHWDEHRQRVAFTYTVLNPAGDECLGCVYIKPLTWWLERGKAGAEAIARVPDFSAVTTFWVRQPRVADDLDRRLLAVLQNWFASDSWAFAAMAYGTNEQDTRQIALLEAAGLARLVELDMGRPVKRLIYGPPRG